MAENKFAAKKAGGITVDVDKAKITVNKGDKAAKAKPAKVAKAKASKAEASEVRTGRPSPFAGKKIKKVAKEHSAREGTLRAALMDSIMGAKNTDEVLGQEVSVGDKTAIVSSADVAHAVENKYISLS